MTAPRRPLGARLLGLGFWVWLLAPCLFLPLAFVALRVGKAVGDARIAPDPRAFRAGEDPAAFVVGRWRKTVDRTSARYRNDGAEFLLDSLGAELTLEKGGTGTLSEGGLTCDLRWRVGAEGIEWTVVSVGGVPVAEVRADGDRSREGRLRKSVLGLAEGGSPVTLTPDGVALTPTRTPVRSDGTTFMGRVVWRRER